jgi:phosphoribosylformylglycinamidine (FGAM) synthase-like amidotransferase family enzyme
MPFATPGLGRLIGDFMINALVITTTGINCDHELAEAFRLAGATPTSLHLNHLLEHPERIEEFDLIGLPGGFSYGEVVCTTRCDERLIVVFP